MIPNACFLDCLIAVKTCSSHLVRLSLVNLGITKSIIPWSMLAERAESVPKLYISNALKALERSALIMKSISENLAHPDEDCEETADLATILLFQSYKS